MINKPRTAQEKQWHNTVAEWAKESDWLQDTFGPFVSMPYDFHIDHIIGASKKRKINLVSVKVGEFAVIPMPIQLHGITSNHPLNRTLRPATFRDYIGDEKLLFKRMIHAMKDDGIEIPFSDEIIKSIVMG